MTDSCDEHRSNNVCGCGAIRLEAQSCQSPSKDDLHVAHVFLLLSASLTTLASPLRSPTTAHLNIHNSTHGGRALAELVEGWRGVMNLSRAMVLSLERPMRELRVSGASSAVAAFRAIESLCERDGAFLVVCMQVHDGLGFVRVTAMETLAQPREEHHWKTVTGTSAQLFSTQCAAWRSEMMQVVALYTEDRSVALRHVAVETLS